MSLAEFDKPTVYDGAKGTLLAPNLPKVGREPSDIAEWLNLLAPEAVRQCHQAYIDAGSQVIQTNTFNGNRFRLAKHGLADNVREVNRAAAQIARVAAGGTVTVAGAMGPSGELLVMGTVTAADITQAFAEQAAALEEGGVDFFHIETIADIDEATAAVEGVRSASRLPIALTMSFDTGDPQSSLRTMMGVSPAQLAQKADELGVAAIGANCGRGFDGYQIVIEQLMAASPSAAVIAKVNAGIPRMEGDEIVYDGTPERAAEYARWCARAGVTLIGVCCGGGPESVKAIADALAQAR